MSNHSITLVELTHSARRYLQLQVKPEQHHLVASMGESYADALFPGTDSQGGAVVPWLRGIERDGEPVGFLMCAEPTATAADPWIWRLLIDARFQGQGLGAQAVKQVLARYRALGCARVMVSWVQSELAPGPFYERLGFVPTGAIESNEIVAAYTFK